MQLLLSQANYINIFFSILIFLIFIVNTSLSFLSVSQKLSPKITTMDMIVYYLTFIPQNPALLEQASAFTSLSMLFIFIVVCIIPHFLLSNYYLPMVRTAEMISFYYIIPVTLTLFINCVGRFMESDYYHNRPTLSYFALFITIIDFAFFIIGICITANSACRINHLFICKNSSFSRLFITFYIIDQMFARYYWVKFDIFRAIMTTAMMLFIAYRPFYLSRFMNILATIMIAYESLVSITMQIDNNPSYKGFYALLGAFIYSLFTNYVIRYIFRKYPKNKAVLIEELYFCGEREECKKFIESITKLGKVEIYGYSKLIQIAVDINCSNLLDIVLHYANSDTLTLRDLILLWNSINLCCIKNNVIPPSYKKKYFYYQKVLDEVENEFWYRVWRSDKYLIPKLAAQVGRLKKAISYSMILDIKSIPSLLDTKIVNKDIVTSSQKYYELNACKILFKDFSIRDWMNVICFIIIVIFQMHLHMKSMIYRHSISSFKTLHNFTATYIYFQFNLFDQDVNMTLLADLKDKFETFMNIVDQEILFDNLSALNEFSIKFQDMLDYYATGDVNRTLEMIEVVKQFENLINNLQVRASIDKPYLIAMLITSFVFAIVYILVLIIPTVKAWKYHLLYAKKLVAIPKSEIKQIGNFSTHVETFEIELDKPNICSSLISTMFYIFFSILFLALYIVCLVFPALVVSHEMRKISLPIEALSNLDEIPLWFSTSIIQYQYGDDYLESLRYLDEVTDTFCHNKTLSEFQFIIPDKLYSMVFSIYAGGVFDFVSAEKIIHEIFSNIYHKADEYSALHRVVLCKFIAFYSLDGIVVLIALYLLYHIKLLMVAEQNEPKLLYEKAKSLSNVQLTISSFPKLHNNFIYLNDYDTLAFSRVNYKRKEIYVNDMFYKQCESADPSRNGSEVVLNTSIKVEYEDNDELEDLELSESEDKKCHNDKIEKSEIESIPFSLFIVSRSMRVKYATKHAMETFGLVINKKFSDVFIDASIMNEIKSSIEKYKKNQSFEVTHVPFSDKEAFIIVPHYGYNLKLSKVVIAAIRDTFTELKHIEDKYHTLFYQIYPRFIDIDTKFPLMIEPVLKSFVLIVVTTVDFDEWAMSQDLSVLQSFVAKRTRLIEENSTEYCCRIRETVDTVILGIDHRQTKLSIWKVLEVATTVIANMRKALVNLMNQYNVNCISRSLVFKCKEPCWYCGNGQNAITDMVSDVIPIALSIQNSVQINALKYATQRKEMKVPNTTKYGISHLPNGDQYELYLIV